MEQEFNAFMEYLAESRNMSENTRASYYLDLNKMERYMAGQGVDSVSKLTETVLNSYILFLERSGMAPSSISRNIASIRSFIRYLLRRKLIEEDISENLKSPRVVRKQPEYLTREEIGRLLEAAEGTSYKSKRDYAMLRLLYATGIHVGELITLQKEDIDLELRFLTCRKGGRERTIPFDFDTASAMKKYLEPNAAGNQVIVGDERYLFTNMSGNSMSRQGFWKMLKSYAVKAGIEKSITPNMIRHSFAIHQVEEGKNPESVRELMGNMDGAAMKTYINIAGTHNR